MQQTQSPTRQSPPRVAARGFVCTIVVLISLFATHAAAQNSPNYAGQILVQRTFYAGSHLVFDDQANPSKKYATCSWTLCAKIRVVGLRLDGDTMRIQGERLFLVSDAAGVFTDVFSDPRFSGAGESLERLKKQREVEIDVRRRGGWDDTAVASALEKIFLSADESLNDVLPDYWKSCAFSKPNLPCADDSPAHLALKVGGDITPPRAQFTPDPKYSEPARQAKYQGTTILWVIITPEGRTSDIRITRALGLGLDDEAVRAVSGWTFEPANRAGQPVAVQINIQVNFRLY